jgi:hypothetical protein
MGLCDLVLCSPCAMAPPRKLVAIKSAERMLKLWDASCQLMYDAAMVLLFEGGFVVGNRVQSDFVGFFSR